MGFGGGHQKKKMAVKEGHLKKVREKGSHVKYFSSAKMGYILLLFHYDVILPYLVKRTRKI